MSRCISSTCCPRRAWRVALSRAIARADGAITPLEGRAIRLRGAELGEATYLSQVVRQGRRVVSGSGALKEFLGETPGRPAAARAVRARRQRRTRRFQRHGVLAVVVDTARRTKRLNS